MKRTTRFWMSMAVFQVVFGLAVFAATRHYYMDPPRVTKTDTAVARPSLLAWGNATAGSGQRGVTAARISTIADPAELDRLANEYFASKQYDLAAQAYERLLSFGSNVNTYNNLGITLFYLGRSDEALSRLNEGIAVDPSYQRIWLTLGYVNSQVGNINEARKALTTAVSMGADNDVGQSAQDMLDSLPG